MRTCLNCHLEKDESEFYRNRSRDDGRSQYCKVCQRARNDEAYQRMKPRVVYETLSKSTLLGRRILAEQGIPSEAGRFFGKPYCDLVAWGCVPVEVKTAQKEPSGRYSFAITTLQRKRGFEGVVLLIARDGQSRRVFVVPAHNEWLKESVANGRIIFTPNAKRSWSTWSKVKPYENHYGIIESQRLQYMYDLRAKMQEMNSQAEGDE